MHHKEYTCEKELWYFSVIDVIEILTDSTSPRRYWSDIKIKLKSEGSEVYDKIVQLKLLAPDGKERETDCFSTEDLLRVIQSIPSPKAEPFKRWLAKVGYERVQEIENPELATKRTRMLYKAKGYSDDWIEKRMRGVAIRLVLPAPDHDFSRPFRVFHARERKIPEERFYQTHSGARRTALWIAQHCPNVTVRVFENAYDPYSV